MDTYTRQAIVRSHQAELLREAHDARLLSEGHRQRPRRQLLAGVGRVAQDVRLLLAGSHAAAVAPRPRFGRETGEGSVTGHMVRPVGA